MPDADPDTPFSILHDLIRQRLSGEGRVAVAVSGGSDSMALLHLCRDMPVVALTVDHGLRLESSAEAQQVKAWVEALGIEHHTLQWSGDKPKTGIQAAARKARYDLMSDWCQKNGFDTLLTAHTADDQAETVVMRRKRSESARSLAGIWPETKWNQIRVLRPLLGVKREVLRAYLFGQGVHWIEDPSNSNRTFERVRVRQSLSVGDVDGLAQQAVVAQGLVAASEKAAANWIEVHCRKFDLGYAELDHLAFQALAPDVAVEVVADCIGMISGAAVSAAEATRLALWAGEAKLGRRTLGGCVFSKRLRTILVAREWRRIGVQVVAVPASGEVVWDNRFRITAPVGSRVFAAGRANPERFLVDLPLTILGGLPCVELAGKGRVLPQFAQDVEIGCEFLRF